MKIGFNGRRPPQAEVDRLTGMGHAVRAADAARLAAECDVVFLGATDAAGARAEALGPDGLAQGLRPGLIVVDRSVSDAEAGRALAADLAEHGVDLVEAPASNLYRPEAGLAPVTFCAGPEAARRTVAALIAGTVIDCGTAGKGHAVNLFNATMGIGAYLATLEVAAMGARFGLGTDAIASVVSAGSGRNRASVLALPRLMAGDAATAQTLGEALALLRAGADAGRRAGVPMILPGVAGGLLQIAVHRYGAEAPVERAIEMVETMAAAALRGRPATATVAPEGDGKALKVGYVGVGTMGGALARRLMLSREMMVYDVNRDLVRALVAEGATAAPDAATLARECDVIMVCVPTSPIVRQVVFGPGGLAEGLSPGKIVVDQTTGNPSETQAIARELERMGVPMVDAPVSGGTRGAVAGTIAIIGGGPQDAFARVHPVLAQISPNIVYCGAIGSGHAAKLVQNTVAACNRVLTLECAAAAVRSGLTLSELLGPLEAGSGWNSGAARILPALRTGAATTDFAIGLMAKDLRLAMDIGNELGAPMMIANAARGLMQVAANENGPRANLDVVGSTVAGMAGVTFTDHA